LEIGNQILCLLDLHQKQVIFVNISANKGLFVFAAFCELNIITDATFGYIKFYILYIEMQIQPVLRMGFSWDTNEMSVMFSAKLGKPLAGTARIVINSVHIKGDVSHTSYFSFHFILNLI
jgi:hypothetical protein